MPDMIRATRPVLSCLLLLTLTIALPSISQAEPVAYANVVGATQGNIPGSVTSAGREDTIQIENYSHNMSAAFDDATGLPTGNHQHRPVRLVKLVDKASAPLFEAMSNNELLTTVTIRFWRTADAALENYATVTLNNAHITNIVMHKSDSPEDATNPMRESVSLTYESITTTDELNTLSATDTWATPPP